MWYIYSTSITLYPYLRFCNALQTYNVPGGGGGGEKKIGKEKKDVVYKEKEDYYFFFFI